MTQLAKVIKQNNAVALVQLLNAGINYLPYRSIEEFPKMYFTNISRNLLTLQFAAKRQVLMV